MGCGCKKNNSVNQPKPATVNINGVATPVVTQPAPQVLQMTELVNKTNTNGGN
jgi:hypothetical protein